MAVSVQYNSDSEPDPDTNEKWDSDRIVGIRITGIGNRYNEKRRDSLWIRGLALLDNKSVDVDGPVVLDGLRGGNLNLFLVGAVPIVASVPLAKLNTRLSPHQPLGYLGKKKNFK